MNGEGRVVQQIVQCGGRGMIAAQGIAVQRGVPAAVFGLADRPNAVACSKAVNRHRGFLSGDGV